MRKKGNGAQAEADVAAVKAAVQAEFAGRRDISDYRGALYCRAKGRILRIVPHSGRSGTILKGWVGRLCTAEEGFIFDAANGFLCRLDRRRNGMRKSACLPIAAGQLSFSGAARNRAICCCKLGGSDISFLARWSGRPPFLLPDSVKLKCTHGADDRPRQAAYTVGEGKAPEVTPRRKRRK